MKFTKESIVEGLVRIRHSKTRVSLVHPKYVDLFIAAPELLLGIKALADFVPKDFTRTHIAIKKLIAKAEGK